MMNEQTTPPGGGPVEPVDGMIVDTTARDVQVDVERYQSYLDDTDLSDNEKRELIKTLWGVMVSFVHLGFGVHPLQHVIDDSDNSCSKLPDRVHSEHQPNTTQNQETIEGEPVLEESEES